MRKLFAIFFCLLTVPAFGAECAIDELDSIRADSSGRDIPVGNYAKTAGAPVTTRAVATITSTEQSSAFAAGVQFIRVICDAKMFFVIGFNPTATTSSSWVAADSAEYFGVEAGLKIAFCDADCT